MLPPQWIPSPDCRPAVAVKGKYYHITSWRDDDITPIMFMAVDEIDNWDEYPVGASQASYPEFIVKVK